jgi:transposase
MIGQRKKWVQGMTTNPLSVFLYLAAEAYRKTEVPEALDVANRIIAHAAVPVGQRPKPAIFSHLAESLAARAYFCLSDSGFPNWVRCDSLPSRQIWGLQMGKPHPIELRTRVVAFVDEGHGHREAARHFRVSPKFVNDLIKLRRVTGSLLPRPQGNGGGHGKLTGVTDWIDARVTAKGEITLDELVAELAEAHGIDVHRGTVWRVLRGLGLTHKKRPAGA